MPSKSSGTVKPRVILISGRTICKSAVENTSSAWNLPPWVKPFAGIFITVILLMMVDCVFAIIPHPVRHRSEEHTSELQSRFDLVCRLLLEKKNVVDLVFIGIYLHRDHEPKLHLLLEHQTPTHQSKCHGTSRSVNSRVVYMLNRASTVIVI